MNCMMNYYDLCLAIHQYITKHINKQNSKILERFTKENIRYMIDQKETEEIEFFLTARKSLDAVALLELLHFYQKCV